MRRLRISGGQRDPAGRLAVEADLERVLPGAREWHIKHQYRTGLNIDHSGGRLTELYRPLTAEQLGAVTVDEADAYRMDSDFSSPAADPEYQMSARIDGGEVGQPDVLKHAQHAEFALLIYKGVVRDNRKIEVQGSANSNRSDDVVLLDLVHHVHSLGNLAKHGVNLIEMRLRCVRNEELAATGVFPSVSHG